MKKKNIKTIYRNLCSFIWSDTCEHQIYIDVLFDEIVEIWWIFDGENSDTTP